MIQIITAMIKTKFAFFEMEEKLIGTKAIELLHTAFGKGPKTFDAVNMNGAIGKLIVGMIDAKMFLKTDINQSVITAPFVGMNNNFGSDAAANNGLQHTFLAIRHDLGIDPAAAFENTKDDCFARCSASTLAAYSPSSEIGFINFDLSCLNRSLTRAFFSQAKAYFLKDRINRLPGKGSQFGCFAGGQIHGKIAY